MIKSLSKKLSIFVLFFLVAGMFFAPKAHATLSNTSDTISTSRPSAAAPLSANTAASAVQAQILDNGSMFLASDSAVIYPDVGETSDATFGKNVASMSATGVPSAGKRTVYLSGSCAGMGCFTNTRHIGDVLVVNITAVHTISFITTAITSGGTITLTFPGGTNNASPSATGFSFNGLLNTGVTFGGTAAGLCTVTVTAPTITCTATSNIAGGTITIAVGSVPTLINPTKTAATGIADLWKLQLSTSNGDSERITIGTVESVQVQATVDPTLTFIIAAENSGSPSTWNNFGNCTTDTDVPTSGISSTANTVNLGLLNTANINIANQLIQIATNGDHGYALTATASGHLIDPTSGFWIRDSATPVAIAANAPWFGIHACGKEAITTPGNWGTGTAGGGALFAWPTTVTPLAIASITSGPIGGTLSTGGLGSGFTAIEYAAAVDLSVPAGLYSSTITYTATPTF